MLTVSWQPWTDSASIGYNLADLWNYETKVERWPEYSAEWHLHMEAIRQAIIQGQIWAGGDWHQYSAQGMPVVSDRHFMSLSWRGWGGLLAAWSTNPTNLTRHKRTGKCVLKATYTPDTLASRSTPHILLGMKAPEIKSHYFYRVEVESWPVLLVALFVLLVGLYGCYKLVRRSRQLRPAP